MSQNHISRRVTKHGDAIWSSAVVFIWWSAVWWLCSGYWCSIAFGLSSVRVLPVMVCFSPAIPQQLPLRCPPAEHIVVLTCQTILVHLTILFQLLVEVNTQVVEMGHAEASSQSIPSLSSLHIAWSWVVKFQNRSICSLLHPPGNACQAGAVPGEVWSFFERRRWRDEFQRQGQAVSVCAVLFLVLLVYCLHAAETKVWTLLLFFLFITLTFGIEWAVRVTAFADDCFGFLPQSSHLLQQSPHLRAEDCCVKAWVSGGYTLQKKGEKYINTVPFGCSLARLLVAEIHFLCNYQPWLTWTWIIGKLMVFVFL